MAEPNTQAAIGLLSRALFGITESAPPPAEPDEPTLSASSITAEGDAAAATIHLPSGDTYEIRVEWKREASP